MKHNIEHTSSMIKSSSYEPTSGDLVVTFNGGAEYSYPMVTEEDYQSFIGSESIGQGFNEHIRKYQGIKLITEDLDGSQQINS
jgi:hypothetical protein